MLDYLYLSGIVIFLYIIIKIIYILQYKVAGPSYDHYGHLMLIQGIKRNKHRLLKYYPNRLGKYILAYPLLFHWILSFFSMSFIEKKFNIINKILNIIYISFIVISSFLIFKLFNFNDYITLTFLTGIFAVLSPFNFLISNAKNRGINIRIVGLVAGQTYLLFLFIFLYNNNLYYIIILTLIGFIIIHTSQFTFQFVLISAPIFSIFFQNYYVLTLPLISIILFFITSPSYALLYFKGQYMHKKIWFLYLSERDILLKRYSIWRDFLYDFWKRKNYKYFLENPIVMIIWGFPLILVPLFAFLFGNNYKVLLLVGLNRYLIYFILVTFLVFVITSFQKTRFLGEPERYIEFVLPFISILAAILIKDNIVLIIIFTCFSFCMIFLQFAWFGFQKENEFISKIEILRNKITLETNNSETNIFSNNTSLLRYFTENPNIQLLEPYVTNEYTGKFHFTEIFPEQYLKVNPDIILPLIDEFNINWFILDQYWLKENELNLDYGELHLDKVLEKDGLILYKVVKA